MSDTTQQKFLKNQVAVVTGGGRGIGREIARHLARVGARVAVTARSGDQLEETADLIRSEGGECLPVTMDVRDTGSVRKGFGQIQAGLGPVDLLVNNAGVLSGGKALWEVDEADFERVMDVNVTGVLRCCQAVIPSMVERKRGRIINVGSGAGVRPFLNDPAYSVSKAALFRVTDNLADALREHGLAVFTISPGLVKTEMTRELSEQTSLPGSSWTPIERAAELCLQLAAGTGDVLSGRYFHATDDVAALAEKAGEIEENNLLTLGLRRP